MRKRLDAEGRARLKQSILDNPYSLIMVAEALRERDELSCAIALTEVAHKLFEIAIETNERLAARIGARSRELNDEADQIEKVRQVFLDQGIGSGEVGKPVAPEHRTAYVGGLIVVAGADAPMVEGVANG